MRLPPTPTPFPYTTLFRSHGIFSWVSRAAQDAIVSIVRQRLQPDGVLYISYNSMPGWAPLAPIRQFMLERSEEHTSELQSRFDLVCRLLLEKKQHHRCARP